MKKKKYEVISGHGSRFTWLPFLIAAVLCTVVPTVLIATGHTEPVRVVTEAITSPIQELFRSAGSGVRDFVARFTEYDRLAEENARLREQVISMEAVLSDAEGVLEENSFLKEFLSMKENHADYRFLKCEAVAVHDIGYSLQITVNAGEQEGVLAGYPVITAEGVLGKVTLVSRNSSVVTPITELSSSIGAYDERSGTEGIAEGNYVCRLDGNFRLSFLDIEADIEIGDRIRTSGHGDSFPRGLLLGTVKEVQWDETTATRVAVIVPAVSVARADSVMILTDFARIAEEETDIETEESGHPEQQNTEKTEGGAEA